MSRTVLAYVGKMYLRFLGAFFLAIVAIFLVADFVDRARYYTGPRWVADVAVLYGYKALVVAHQLAPAALLLAAGATVSALRKRGELTALNALCFGPTALYLPIGLTALVGSVGLMAFDEWVVVKAGKRVDEMTALRFKRWGDWRFHFSAKRWFRHGERVFYLRQGDAVSGFEDVTILRLTPDFQLASRVDAQRMGYLEGTRWRLEQGVDRRFGAEGESEVHTWAQAEVELGVGRSAFHIQLGRPEQMQLGQLAEQIHTRQQGGLPTRAFVLAWHNRFAYPLAGLPAVLLAIGVALRPGRRGHLTAAMVEGMSISLLFWGMMVLCRALAMAEHLRPLTAAWLPWGVLVGGAAGVWLWQEGWVKRKLARV